MKLLKQGLSFRPLGLLTGIILLGVLISAPALAHHPLEGRLPANLFEGIMSGFGHPIIGIDHLAFVAASGLIALGIAGGAMIPIAFVVATGIGAGIHLAAIDLPLPELFIAASVVLFGILLVIRDRKRQDAQYKLIVSSLAALAGLFHGFAYGEGIFGAEPTPLIAYLIGFMVIQLAISLGIYGLVTKLSKTISINYVTRLGGFAIAAIGMVFLSSAITG